VPRALLILTIGSIITLVAATYNGTSHDFWGVWSVVCSATSTGISLFLCLALAWGAGDKVSGYMGIVSVLLLVLWIFGTGFMTFKAPFVKTSNGYFGAWLALIAAFTLCKGHSETVRGLIGKLGAHGHLMIALFLASAVLLVQTLIDTIDHAKYKNEVVAWICSVTSLVLCIVVVVLQPQDAVLKWIMLAMFVLWCVGVGFLTFDGPYVFSSNAYFACWVALFVSKAFVWRLFPEVVPRSTPEVESKPTTGPVAAVVGAVFGESV
jgi:hypothetical protein